MSSPGPGTMGDINRKCWTRANLQQERVEALNSWEAIATVQKGDGEALN